MGMWVKPSGVELEVNETEGSIAAAEGFGWKRKRGPKKKSKEKKAE